MEKAALKGLTELSKIIGPGSVLHGRSYAIPAKILAGRLVRSSLGHFWRPGNLKNTNQLYYTPFEKNIFKKNLISAF